jgi:hypothetical protein
MILAFIRKRGWFPVKIGRQGAEKAGAERVIFIAFTFRLIIRYRTPAPSEIWAGKFRRIPAWTELLGFPAKPKPVQAAFGLISLSADNCFMLFRA